MDTGHIDNSLRDTITREVKTAVSNSQQELLSNITSLMDSRLSSFQTSIQQSQVEISQTQISKMEETLTDSYTFQRKGNENQFKHEIKVLTKLKEAKTHLEGPELGIDSVQTAKTKIEEGIDLVKERQKLIKLADSSALGWKVVTEYISNPIADDSDDEKRMARAQARAEKKNKTDKMKRNKNIKSTPYTPVSEKRDDRQRIRTGRCFNCGKRGHWADECPEKKSKISNFNRLLNLKKIQFVKHTSYFERVE